MRAVDRHSVQLDRAISTRDVFLAEVALGELETVLLEDVLQLVRLYGEEDDPKYASACRRYLTRWIVEESPSLEDIAATACQFVERGQPRLPLTDSGDGTLAQATETCGKGSIDLADLACHRRGAVTKQCG